MMMVIIGQGISPGFWISRCGFLSPLLILLLIQKAALSFDEPVAPFSETQFALEEEGLFLPVEAFEEKMDFAIDTGATGTAIENKFRKNLGKLVVTEKALTVSAVQSMDFFAAPEMRIGSGESRIVWKGELVGCVDFTDLKQAFGREQIGILGMDFMRDKILRLNFDDGYFQFPSKPSIEFSHSEQIRYFKRMPQVIARLPNEGFKHFVIDTGAFGSSLALERRLFDRLLKQGKIKFFANQGRAQLNQSVVNRDGILESFEFGPHRFFNLVVSEAAYNFIRVPFLRRFDVELDFPSRVARFRPGKGIDQRDRYDQSGLGVGREKGVIFAHISDPALPAAQAGIQSGDQILEVNGISAHELSLTRIRHLRSEPGTELRVRFAHEGIEKEVVLQLPDDPDSFPAKSPHEEIIPDKSFDD